MSKSVIVHEAIVAALEFMIHTETVREVPTNTKRSRESNSSSYQAEFFDFTGDGSDDADNEDNEENDKENLPRAKKFKAAK